jgi:hypothetical protein
MVLVLLFALGSWVAALEPDAACGLTAEDCVLLERSTAVMATVVSSEFSFDFTVRFSDSARQFEYDLSFLGAGSYVLEPGAMDELAALQGNSNRALLEQWEIASQGINSELILTLSLPSDVANMLNAPSKISLPLRLVDGVGYANLDELAELDRNLEGGWYSFAMDELAPLMMIAMSGQTPTEPIQNTAAFNQYVNQTRLEDVVIQGADAAVYEMTIDLEGLLQDPAVEDILREAIEDSIRQQGIRNVDAAIDEYWILLNTFDLRFVQTIGIDDAYLYALNVEMSYAPTREEARSLARSELFAGISNLGEMAFLFELRLWNHDNAEAVTAPRNAQPVTLNDLLQGMR